MDWLTFPTPEVAAHSLLDVSGAGGLGLLLALVGLWAAAPCRRPRSRLSASRPGRSPVRRRAADLGRAADLPRPLSHRGVAGVRVARGRRDPGRRLQRAASVATVAAVGIGLGSGTRRTRSGAGRTGGARSHGARAAGRGRRQLSSSPPAPAEYYGARLVDVSTAGSRGCSSGPRRPRDVEAAERRALGFGDHVRVEKLQFGRRLSAQPGDGSPD